MKTILEMAPEKVALVIRLMAECGLRVSEAAPVTLEDITESTDDSSELLRLRINGKNSDRSSQRTKPRHAWISQTLYDDLVAYCQ